MTYKIIRLYDEADCETCGTNYADGYVIEKDGEVVIDKTPTATCFGGGDYSDNDPYKDILVMEGIEVIEE